MWHTIRSPGGWQAWGDVSATVTGNPGINFKTVACASIGNDLHVISVADNGNMWHTIRSPGGWQAWGDVSATVTGNPGINFKTVACASIGNDLHVISVVTMETCGIPSVLLVVGKHGEMLVPQLLVILV